METKFKWLSNKEGERREMDSVSKVLYVTWAVVGWTTEEQNHV